MGLISRFYRAFEVIPGYRAPDSIVNRKVHEIEDPPDDWPDDAAVAPLEKGREMFGDCPACGATAMAANQSVIRGGSTAECKQCDFTLASVSDLGFGQEEYECIDGPEEILGEQHVQETWRNMEGRAGD